MRIRITLPSFFLFFLVLNIGYGQDYFTLTGRVLDKESRQPVAYAHVGIPEKGIGTTTGFDGGFEFKVPKEFEHSMMIVSFMGYQTYKNPVRPFQHQSTIYIEPATNMLTEVVVMEQKAIEDIIRLAVKNIPANYPTKPTRVLAFYREALTDDSLRYRYLAEGVLHLYKTGYSDDDEGQTGVVQGRKVNLRNPLDTNVHSGLSSGHMAGHRFDFVKNREDFIDERYFRVYRYWLESITTYNDRPVYIIGFDKDGEAGSPGNVQKKMKKRFSFTLGNDNDGDDGPTSIEARMKGRLYIEQGSYAFVRAEFEHLPEALDRGNDYPLYVGDWLGNRYVVNYREQNGKWHFGDALREGKRGSGGRYSNEIKVTEIPTGKAERIPYAARMERGEQFVQLTGRYDEDFWRNYNTTPMSAGLAESVQQYRNAQKAQEAFNEQYQAALQRQKDSIATIAQLPTPPVASTTGPESIGNITDDIDFMPEELQRVRDMRRRFEKVKFMLGTGAHFLPSEHGPLSISYFDGDGEAIVSVTKDISPRELEVFARWEFDIFLRRHLFLRFGHAFDFYDSVYRDWSLGLGTQINLSKQRPLFFKPTVQYSYLRHARMVGNADNDYGKFKAGNDKFRSESVRLSYGSRLHNLNLSGDLSIELNGDRELYFRGTYHWTFASRQDVWFRERKVMFRAKERLSIDHDRLSVVENNMPFSARLTPAETFSVTVGLVFK